MTAPPLQAHAVVPVFRVTDVARTIAWYQDQLGFEAEPFPAAIPYEFAILRRGPVEFMLRRSRGGRPPQAEGWDAYVRLDADIRALHAALQQQGLVTRRLERMPYGDAEFEVRDPDGYRLCFSQVLDDVADLPTPTE